MILRLRGLPFTASTKDVVEFFAGFDVETVYLGNRNGVWLRRELGARHPAAC